MILNDNIWPLYNIMMDAGRFVSDITIVPTPQPTQFPTPGKRRKYAKRNKYRRKG